MIIIILLAIFGIPCVITTMYYSRKRDMDPSPAVVTVEFCTSYAFGVLICYVIFMLVYKIFH